MATHKIIKSDGEINNYRFLRKHPYFRKIEKSEIIGEASFDVSDWRNTGMQERCTGCGRAGMEKETVRTNIRFSGDIPKSLKERITRNARATAGGCCSPLISPEDAFITR